MSIMFEELGAAIIAQPVVMTGFFVISTAIIALLITTRIMYIEIALNRIREKISIEEIKSSNDDTILKKIENIKKKLMDAKTRNILFVSILAFTLCLIVPVMFLILINYDIVSQIFVVIIFIMCVIAVSYAEFVYTMIALQTNKTEYEDFKL